MPELPEGFRVLTGTDLLRAQEARERYIEGLAPAAKDGRAAGINDCSRIIGPESSIDTDRVHLAAIRDAAAAVGDSKVWMVTDDAEVSTIFALEAELTALFEFVSKTDFHTGDEWIPEAMRSWPEEAVAAAYPDDAMNWTMISPTESWGYVNTDTDDYGINALAGTSAFMHKYRELRPDAPFDVLIWMHNGAYGLIEAPPLKWNWFRRRLLAGPPTRTRELDRYMESLYGSQNSDWLWALYVETFTEGYGQQMLEGWKKFEEGLITRIKSDPANETRLLKIWDESRPG